MSSRDVRREVFTMADFVIVLRSDGTALVTAEGVRLEGDVAKLIMAAQVLGRAAAARRIAEAGETEALTTKRCSGPCKLELPLNEFGSNRSRPDGKHVECKACHRIQVKASDCRRGEELKAKRAVVCDGDHAAPPCTSPTCWRNEDKAATPPLAPPVEVPAPAPAPAPALRLKGSGRPVGRCKVMGCGAVVFLDEARGHLSEVHEKVLGESAVRLWFDTEEKKACATSPA